MTGGETEHIFVLGAGRAGKSLARALRVSGLDIVGLHGRTPEAGDPPVSAGALPPSIGTATIVLVTVRDAQLEDALHELASASLARGAVVLHASGSGEPLGLAVLRADGHPCGTLHPLVPLANPARAVEVLRGAWIGIDGDTLAMDAARRLATAMGAHTLVIPAGEKRRYHAAAVFAANFPTVLAALAESMLQESGVSAGEARAAVEGLMAAAVDNVRSLPSERMLTGPVARGEPDLIARHLETLGDDPVRRDVYVALTRAAVLVAARGGTDPAALRSIAAMLEESPKPVH